MLVFDDVWKERVSLLIGGQKITAIGEIREVSDNSVTLDHCELID
jgi:hypothetical protein